MDNPFFWQTYGIAGILAFAAGLVPVQPRYLLILQVILLCLAVIIFHVFLGQYVNWAYDHPFNPSDGAAKSFAMMFGWLMGLVWPILPLFLLARGVIWLYKRFIGRASA